MTPGSAIRSFEWGLAASNIMDTHGNSALARRKKCCLPPGGSMHRKPIALAWSTGSLHAMGSKPRRSNSPTRSRRCTRMPCRSEEHTSELQTLMRTSYAAFCLKKHTQHKNVYRHKAQNKN